MSGGNDSLVLFYEGVEDLALTERVFLAFSKRKCILFSAFRTVFATVRGKWVELSFPVATGWNEPATVNLMLFADHMIFSPNRCK
jgi:hypothetical protein